VEIKKWQARGEDDKQELQNKKNQNLFNNKTGLLANNINVNVNIKRRKYS
jgi:hypothetical protein